MARQDGLEARVQDGDGLDGQVALVTGAARGVGRATVRWLRARGALVVAEDLRAEVDDLAERDTVVSLVADISDEQAAERAVALANDRFGRLDVLVNNAGRAVNSLGGLGGSPRRGA